MNAVCCVCSKDYETRNCFYVDTLYYSTSLLYYFCFLLFLVGFVKFVGAMTDLAIRQEVLLFTICVVFSLVNKENTTVITKVQKTNENCNAALLKILLGLS